MTNPARRMRRNMEQSIIKASRKAISDLARTRLADDASAYRAKLAAEAAAAEELAQVAAKVRDLKDKEVRQGPRDAV